MISPDPQRAAEERAIAAFIAAYGVTRGVPAFAAPSPQGALTEPASKALLSRFEPQAEAQAQEVVNYLRSQGRKAWTNNRLYRLDNRLCARGDLYRAANKHRETQGLIPYRLPNAFSGGA